MVLCAKKVSVGVHVVRMVTCSSVCSFFVLNNCWLVSYVRNVTLKGNKVAKLAKLLNLFCKVSYYVLLTLVGGFQNPFFDRIECMYPL